MSEDDIESEQCPDAPASHVRELIDNIPYAVMLLLGAAILRLTIPVEGWSWVSAVLYVLYGVAGTLWIMVFICPYCHFYDTRLCPCGYGQFAPRLRARKDPERFTTQFRKHIPVIVPLWFVPPIVAGLALWRDFAWLPAGLLLAFAINSFVILPLVSKKYGCAQCPQKESCPWMGTCRTGE